ncbi:MAG TPA: ABC transporter permease [Chloroflexota bacterium]|nr:ABC transporter permease [Chloroflexota bacterium]
MTPTGPRGGTLWPIVHKELLQIVRDRRTLGMLLVLPVVQLLLFGYAVSTTVSHIPSVISDQTADGTGRDLERAIVNSTFFDVVEHVHDGAAAKEAIDAGRAKAAFVIPSDYAAAVTAGRPTQVQVLIDGSDPNIAQTALFAADALGRVQAGALQTRTLQRAGLARTASSAAPPIEFRPQVLYNPGMSSAHFMVPGLIGMILQMLTLTLTAFAVVRERERGTLEQLIVTPVRRWELLLGKILPYAIIAFWNVAVALVVGRLVFGVAVSGSLLLLLVLSFVFLLGSLGVGLLISTVSRTQAQALQTAYFIMLPSFILSGFFFPREAMPAPMFWLGYVIPLTYFLRILRGIVLKGVGIEHLWVEVVPLAILSLGVFALSVSRFRKTIE